MDMMHPQRVSVYRQPESRPTFGPRDNEGETMHKLIPILLIILGLCSAIVGGEKAYSTWRYEVGPIIGWMSVIAGAFYATAALGGLALIIVGFLSLRHKSIAPPK